MRTTLDIADDVLMAAKETARRDKRSMGEVISELARRALLEAHAPPARRSPPERSKLARLGIAPLPRRGGIVTNEAINRLRDDGLD